jgi:hypothetical protein
LEKTMKRLARVLLSLSLSTFGATGCGGTAPPTVLLNIMGVSEMTALIDTTLTSGGRSATTSFYRDSNNSYINTPPPGMPPMVPSPANIQLAFDLPEKTTGTVRITLLFKGAAAMMPMMPMAPLSVLQSGCATADVSAGGLVTVPVTPMMGQVSCP